MDEAVVELIVSKGGQLKRSAMSYSLCREDADDAYQRGLEILITKGPTTRQDELVRWLYTVIKHEALAIRRQRERLLGSESVDRLDIPGDGRGPDELAAASEHVGRASEAVQHLKTPEMRCLVMKAHGFSYDEIADTTGWSWTKVNRSISEGRASFLQRFKAIESGEQCQQLQPQLSALVDGEVDPAGRKAVQLHLRSCSACRATLREYRSIGPRIAAALPPVLLGIPIERSLEATPDSGMTVEATNRISDGVATGLSDGVSAAWQGLKEGFQLLVRHASDSPIGRVATQIPPDPSGLSATAKVCTGAACLFIASGATAVGIHKGTFKREGAKERSAKVEEINGQEKSQKQPVVPPVSGPAPDTVSLKPVPSQSEQSQGSADQKQEGKSQPAPANAGGGPDKAQGYEFLPDNSGEPVEAKPKNSESSGSSQEKGNPGKPSLPPTGDEDFEPRGDPVP